MEVFISYSRTDRALIAPIAARLDELGVNVWYDHEIPSGESFASTIRARLKDAKAVLVCWSPAAVSSEWVDAEADIARKLGTYVPVFVGPCELEPPYNRIHAEDLSKWNGAADDAAWLKVLDRLAKMLGRDGVASTARAIASGDETARYEFARSFPEEPVARKIWASAESRLREDFEKRLAEARAAGRARIDADHDALEKRLAASTSLFEAWLADDRRGAAKATKPDPLALVSDDSRKPSPDDIRALARSELGAREAELSKAKAEIERLSAELANAEAAPAVLGQTRGSRIRAWALAAAFAALVLAVVGLLAHIAAAPSSIYVRQLQAEITSAKQATAAAESAATKLQSELTSSQSQARTESVELESLRAAVADKEKKLSDATASLAAAKDQEDKSQSDLKASQSQLQTTDAELEKLRAAIADIAQVKCQSTASIETLGIGIGSLDQKDQAACVEVTSIDPRSDASTKGIKVGNYVVEIDDQKISSPIDLLYKVEYARQQLLDYAIKLTLYDKKNGNILCTIAITLRYVQYIFPVSFGTVTL